MGSVKMISVAAAVCVMLMINSTPAQSTTAYDVLKSYNLPVGLLPLGVVGYDLDTSTGEFSVYLSGSCSVSISSIPFKYDSTVKGYISDGKISSLTGVSMNYLLAWVNVETILVDGINVQFDIGVTSVILPAVSFLTSPICE